MSKKTYNKLVRDLIPKIIERSGKVSRTHIACSEEYLRALSNKLREEAEEFIENPCEEEIADILEVIEALVKANGFNMEAILEIKKDKVIERGAFVSRLILETVEG